jgi:hypothetical protein
MPDLKSSPRVPFSFDEENKDLKCWSVIIPKGLLDSNRIDKIRDDDTSGRLQTASIPNPLARIYLFKNAFEYFTKSENINAPFDGPYAALVSDGLDLLQFLFENQDNDAIVLKDWHIDKQLNTLKGSSNHKHQHLGESLELFFDDKFRHNGFNVIQLIYYKHNGEEILLGGTSPFTWVYTSPNWRREMQENAIELRSANHQDVFFDEEVFPLVGRDEYFRKYLYFLARENPNYTISNYITECWGKLDKYTKIDETFEAELGDISYSNSQLRDVTLAVSKGTSSIKLKKHVSASEDDSDLKIAAETNLYSRNSEYGGHLPLIIVSGLDFNGRYFGRTPYVRDCLVVTSPIQTRRIPGTSTIYPYLTTEDFFEDTLVKLPYQVNNDNFHVGQALDRNGNPNPEVSEGNSFLVPLRKRYFDFFKPETINTHLSFQLTSTAIIYTLQIPIKGGGTIPLRKTYELDEDVSEVNVGLAAFPLLKYYKSVGGNRIPAYNSHKVVAFIENEYNLDIDIHSLSLNNIDGDSGSLISGDESKVISAIRKTNTGLGYSKHYKIKTDFDYLRLYFSLKGVNISGLIIPKFVEREEGQNIYRASIDFGTTNTFVGIDNGADNGIAPLTINREEMCLGFLNKPGRELYSGFGSIKLGVEKAFKTEFIPPAIGGVGLDSVAFPIRTVSVFDISDDNPAYEELFLHSNIAFFYEQDQDNFGPTLRYNYISNIKPLFEMEPVGSIENKVKNFIEELLFLLKCKVLYNNGSLRKFSLIWSYPSTGDFKKSIGHIFSKSIPDIFGQDHGKSIVNPLNMISESLAPFIYLREFKENGRRVVPDLDDGVSINVDIGGGTTDIVLFDSNSESYFYSSVKFAGNDLWGGGLSNSMDNGFTRAWESLYKEKLLRADSRDQEFLRYKVLQARPGITASDKVNLLFKYNDVLRFTDIFRNKAQKFDCLKYPLYLHLTSIFHYALEWSQKLPISIRSIRNISFSGKGSSYINLILTDSELSSFLKAYLENYNESQNSRLTLGRVIMLPNPKEVTALGALYRLRGNYEDLDNQGKVNKSHFLDRTSLVAGEEGSSTRKGGIAGKRSVQPSQAELHFNDEVKDHICSYMDAFSEVMLTSDDIAEILSSFDISWVYETLHLPEEGQNEFRTIVRSSLNNSIRTFKKEREGSVFFYPLKDALYEISNFIFNSANNESN